MLDTLAVISKPTEQPRFLPWEFNKICDILIVVGEVLSFNPGKGWGTKKAIILMIDNHGCSFLGDTNWTSIKPGLMEDKG